MSAALVRLLGVMRELRDPETGCAWDRAQTMQTIVPHTLEEAHELADAVAGGDRGAVRDELGDLLFQVVFLARIAEEEGAFDFDAVAAAIADKLERRHPHVFAAPDALSAAEQTVAWEGFKAAERAAVGQVGTLDGVARALPALTRASKLGKRAARVGFDWPDPGGVRAKVDEELGEFEATLRDAEPRARQEDELGDVFAKRCARGGRDYTEARHSIIYLVNELLENAIKFKIPGDIELRCSLESGTFEAVVSNHASPEMAARFQSLLAEMTARDPGELLIERIEANAADEDSSASGLGLLTLMNDYGARLGWSFRDRQETGSLVVSTHASLTLN